MLNFICLTPLQWDQAPFTSQSLRKICEMVCPKVCQPRKNLLLNMITITQFTLPFNGTHCCPKIQQYVVWTSIYTRQKNSQKAITRQFSNRESRLLSRISPAPMVIYERMWTKGQWPQFDLWHHFCWGHMCDFTQGSFYPSTTKICQSMWIQWPFFSKTWTKGYWSLDDLWPQVCWGHMCDFTQGSLCPSPMKIHQSMWIQWPFFQKLEPKVIDP